MLLKFAAILLAVSCFSLTSVQASDSKVVRLTATEWPPYLSANLSDQGISAAIVKATFASAGYSLEVEFAAWKRSFLAGISGTAYDGIILIYYSKAREKDCLFSRPVGKSSLGFVQRRDTPIIWNKLEDLKGVRIGTVLGYLNTKEFDKLVEDKVLDASTVYTDRLNLRRVAYGRIDLAVIDRLTLQHLLTQDEQLKPYRNLLEFNPRLLAEQNLHICFAKNERGRLLKTVFDQAFDMKKAEQIIQEAIERLSKQ
ncbi:MAG: ABC transporter [Kordiimonadales bacterium]|nr:MAG: ABC transporter [Kordiimonadales bacterium]